MLLAGPISHTSTQYIDFVDFYISLDLSTIHFAHFRNLVGVELPLCVVVTLSPCITSVQYCGGCSVLWGIASVHVGDSTVLRGNNISTAGG